MAGPSSSDIGSVKYFRSFRVKPHPPVFNTLRSISSEVKSESSVFNVSMPHTAHPPSNFEGSVALEIVLIIFLRKEASGGSGGKVLCPGAFTSKLSGNSKLGTFVTCDFFAS